MAINAISNKSPELDSESKKYSSFCSNRLVTDHIPSLKCRCCILFFPSQYMSQNIILHKLTVLK